MSSLFAFTGFSEPV